MVENTAKKVVSFIPSGNRSFTAGLLLIIGGIAGMLAFTITGQGIDYSQGTTMIVSGGGIITAALHKES